MNREQPQYYKFFNAYPHIGDSLKSCLTARNKAPLSRGNSLSPSGEIGLRKYFADIITLLRIIINSFKFLIRNVVLSF